MTQLFSALQQSLENVYRIDGVARVADFCIERDHVVALFGNDAPARREALLVQEDESGEGADIDKVSFLAQAVLIV